MKGFLFGFKFKNMLIASILIGCLLGAFDVSATSAFGGDEKPSPEEGLGWSCPVSSITTGGNTCTSSGCIKKGGVDGYWVCKFSGTDCPPIEACSQ